MAKKPVGEIGARIREIRRDLGMNQTLFGGIFTVSQEAVSAWEKGAYPDAMVLLEIASRGQTSVEWILTGDGMKSPPGSGLDLGEAPELEQETCSVT